MRGGLAHLVWQRRLPWLLAGLLLLGAGGLTVYIQGRHLTNFISVEGISIPPLRCPESTRCEGYYQRYGDWLRNLWAFLVARQGAHLWFFISASSAVLLGLMSAVGSVPKPGDTLWAARLLRRRAEEDPWQARHKRPLRLPRGYGRFWATRVEIRDMLSAQLRRQRFTLLLGRWGRDLLGIYPGWGRRDELDHTLWVAPTGSGKGMIIKANLVGWPGSAIVNELKGEFYRDSSGHATQRGVRCLRFGVDGTGDRYDPFVEFDEGLGLQAAAKILIQADQEGRNRIFGDRAAIALYAGLLAARRLGRASLPYLAEISAHGLRAYLEALTGLDDPDISRRVNAFLSEPPDEANWDDIKQDRFLQSCWGNFVTKLEPLFSPNVLAATSGCDFTAAALRTWPTHLYLHFPQTTLEATLPLFQLVTEALLRGVSVNSRPGDRTRPLLWVCDEAHLLTPPRLPEHLNTLREYGVAAMVVLQSRAQLRTCYGHDGAETIEAACATQVYYRPADQETARYVSERAGEAPFPQESTSQRLDRQSVNVNLTARPLIRPEAVGELANDQVVVFPRGRPPVAARRLWPTHTPNGRAAFEVQRQGDRTLLTPRYPAPALKLLEPPLNQLERPAEPPHTSTRDAVLPVETAQEVIPSALSRIARAREGK